MDIKAEKIQLIQQILQINDVILINSVKNLLAFGLKSQDTEIEAVTDFWTTLNKKQKSQIELSIQQLDGNQGIEHKQVMTEFRKKYQK